MVIKQVLKPLEVKPACGSAGFLIAAGLGVAVRAALGLHPLLAGTP